MNAKHKAASLLLVFIFAFSGCTTGGPASSAPSSPAAATQTPAAATAAPEGTPAKFSGIVYTSESLCIAFNVPLAWADKCRVEEGGGWLTVYFDPHAPIDPDEGDGELFCIVKMTQDIDESCYDNSKTFNIDGVEYIWGEPTDVRYQQSQPSYNTYDGMTKDLPGVRDSVRAATGSEPGNVIPTVTFTTPETNVYASEALGIAFTTPESWVGRYRVEEREGSLAVFFIPQDPEDEVANENHLFYIRKKTADDSIPLDGDTEFTVDGVAFFWSIPTDVQYMGPEEDTFRAMNDDLPGILASVRAADEADTETNESIPASDVYTSQGLGLTFTVPDSWVGKYRVEEGGGYLSVYFNPTEPLRENSWSGELFSIGKEESEESEYIDGDWTFELNGTAYVWGMIDFMSYSEIAPEYDTYAAMQKDIPAVFATVESLSESAPENVKKLRKEAIPDKAMYATTMGLGIAFTLPDSWIGKCRIVESEYYVSFFFNPEEPMDTSLGDGFFFSISRKTSEDDAEFMDSVIEFDINGVTYISGTSTDVPYSEEQPEYDTYRAMCGDREKILDSVRAAE